MIRVVLADDQALVRSGLRALLANSDDLEVVGEAVDGRDAVAVPSACSTSATGSGYREWPPPGLPRTVSGSSG
jgi:hypothetical protein